MTIQIQAPDGTIAEFPEGTSDDVIKGAMRKAFPAPGGGVWDTIKDQGGKALQALDDMGRLAVNGATLGYADKFAGYMSGSGTEAERQKSAEAKSRAGLVPAAFAELGGMMAPWGLASKGVGIAANAAGRIPGLGRIAASPIAQDAATGALVGYGNAKGNDEAADKGAMYGAAGGAAGRVVGDALAGGVNKAASYFNPNPKVMSPGELSAAKSAAYKSAEDAGVVFKPELFQKVAGQAKTDLAELGYDPGLQPKIAAVLNRLENAGENNISLKGADIVRRVAQNAYEPGNKSSNMMMQNIINKIDDALASPGAADVLMGDAAKGTAALTEGRDLARRSFKLDAITEALAKGTRAAQNSGSGGNIENATRQKIASILNSPSRSRGFSPDELAAMEKVVGGSGTGHAIARNLGKQSLVGNGLMAGIHGVGALATGGASTAIPLVGTLAKPFSERATAKNVDELVRIISAGGKRSDAFAPPNVVQRLSQSKREALARALAVGLPVAGQQIQNNR